MRRTGRGGRWRQHNHRLVLSRKMRTPHVPPDASCHHPHTTTTTRPKSHITIVHPRTCTCWDQMMCFWPSWEAFLATQISQRHCPWIELASSIIDRQIKITYIKIEVARLEPTDASSLA